MRDLMLILVGSNTVIIADALIANGVGLVPAIVGLVFCGSYAVFART